MNKATIDGIFESLDEGDVTPAAAAEKGGSLFGRVKVSESGNPFMAFRLVDLDTDPEPSPEEGWAYIGYYSDENL